jgi:DNA replication protein DnaC
METETHIASALPFKGDGSTIDLEARAEWYRTAAILHTRREYFNLRCPPKYADFNPGHADLQHNRAQIDRILGWKPGGKGLIASGKTGLGKTRSMYALCKRLLCDEGRDVAIWHAQEFFSELQANVRFGRDEAGDFVKRQANRAILFIDDYGQEALQTNREDWAQGWFFRLLDLRIGNGFPLLMTTNLSAVEMVRGLEDSTRDIAANPMIRRLLDLTEPVKFAEDNAYN